MISSLPIETLWNDDTPDMVKSYLTNRMQFVEIEGTGSNLLHREKGVPQGSILGPLLFIIYINDIHKSSKEFNSLHMQMTLLFSVHYPPLSKNQITACEDASAKINGEISKVTDWLTVNRLSLNVNKTKFMVFHYYQRTLGKQTYQA